MADPPRAPASCSDEPLDRAHGVDQPTLLGVRERVQEGGDLFTRSDVERGEGSLSLPGEGEELLAAVRPRASLGDQPALPETAQDAAEVARIEAEILAEVARRGALPVCQLVEDAHFGQGERARQQALAEEADRARVIPVERPHRYDSRFESLPGHQRDSPPDI